MCHNPCLTCNNLFSWHVTWIMQEMDNAPDLLDDTFLLAGRAAAYAPRMLLHETILPLLLDTATVRSCLRHAAVDVCSSICKNASRSLNTSAAVSVQCTGFKIDWSFAVHTHYGCMCVHVSYWFLCISLIGFSIIILTPSSKSLRQQAAFTSTMQEVVASSTAAKLCKQSPAGTLPASFTPSQCI